MTRYTPADTTAWIVLAADRRVLAIEPGAAERADELGARLASEQGFAAALEAIVRAGILSAPAFALVDWSTGPLRAVLRGDAVLTTSDGEASGRGVQTWTEVVLPTASAASVVVPGGTVGIDGLGAIPEVAAPVAPSAVGADENAAPAERPASVPPVADTETTIVPSELSETPDAPDAPEAPAPLAESGDADDDLFGETVVRTIAGAAVRVRSEDADRLGDHDGETVAAADIVGLADRARPDTAEVPVSEAATPSFALVPASGDPHPLDRGVVIGRAPSVSQVSGGSIPRLVTIADDADISRNHVRIAIEGDAPIVTDLGSKNGTSVLQPGKPPQRLRGNEPTIVLPGTVVDLGGGVEFTIRVDT